MKNLSALPGKIISFDDSVDCLGLGTRSRNGLSNLKIKTINELIAASEDELLKAKNLGRLSVIEIKEKLGMYGLSLRMLPHTSQMGIPDTIDNEGQLPLKDIKLYYLFKPIEETSIPLRARNCFREIGVNYVYEAIRKDIKSISTLRNMGAGTFAKLEDEFAKYGCRFGSFVDVTSNEVKLELIEQFNNHTSSLMPGKIEEFLEKDLLAEILISKFNFNVPLDENYYSENHFDGVLSELINTSLEEFDENEQKIIFSRILDVTPQTLEEVGLQLGVTRERIRQIQKNILKDMSVKFSIARTFLNRCIANFNKRQHDPFESLVLSRHIFAKRETFTEFLDGVGVDQVLISTNYYPDISIEKKVVTDLLLNHQMPIDKAQVLLFLQENYFLTSIQSENIFEKLKGSLFLEFNGRFVVNAPTKVLGVANVSLLSPNGMQWDMIAKISQTMFPKCINIRTEGSADGSITDNPYLYLSARGTYKNVKFYPLSAEEETIIINKFKDYVEKMKEDVKHLPQVVDELNLKQNVYDILHLLKDRSGEFHFECKAGRMLLKKFEQVSTAGIDAQSLVYSYLKERQSPLTTFDLKECLTSKSENHVMFVLSQLIEAGKVIRIDDMRYSLVENYDINLISLIKGNIKQIIQSTPLLIAGSYLKKQIEERSANQTYHRYFYSSLAKIVCKEEGFSWVRHCCSKEYIEQNFSLRSFATNLYDCGNQDYDSFCRAFNQKILSDDVTLRRYYDVAKRTSKNGLAA